MLKIVGRLVNMPSIGEATVVGDLHGDLESIKHILRDSGFVEKAGEGREAFMIFLGDYGDRGPYSPEVYCVVLKLKTLFPERVVLLRGNHEGPDDLLAYPHDLPRHLRRRFGENGSEAYAKLRELFGWLHNAVLVEDKYVLLHGGVPSEASELSDVAYAHERHPMETHLEEILWSDPYEGISGTFPSPRGAGRLFGEDVTARFLKMLNVKLLVRGHEPADEGYKTNHGGKVLTLFSRKGAPYYNNRGAYLGINLSSEVEDAKQLKGVIKSF